MIEPDSPPTLPANWAWDRASNVCLKIQDGTHFSPKNQQPDGQYKYVTAKNIRPWGMDLQDVTYLTEQDHRVIYERCDPKKGDVLLVKDGVNTGDVALNTLDEEFSLLSSVCMLRPDERVVEGAFLRYFLQSPIGFSSLTGQMSGTAIKRIVLHRIRDLPVPIAPLPEQGRIVAEIETQFTRLDAAVAALERVRANLKQYRAAVLAAAFSGQLVPKEADLADTAGKPYESGEDHLTHVERHRYDEWLRYRSGSTVVRGEYPAPRSVQRVTEAEIPRGWVRTTIDHIAVVVRGASPRPAGDPRYFGGTTPWITVGSLTKDGKPHLRQVTEFVTEAGRAASRYIEPGTFLLTNSGATLGVPKISLIGGCINDGSVALLFLPEHLKLFLWMYLSSLTPQLRMINQGAAQPNLNTTIVKSIEVPIPPRGEVARIVTEVERRLSVADEIEATIITSLKRVERFRQSILRKAFAGQLVPQDPADEPASVLLERIRAERALAAALGPKGRPRGGKKDQRQNALW